MSFSPFSLDESLNNVIELFSLGRSAAADAFRSVFLPQADVFSGPTDASQQPQAVEFLAGLQQCGCRLEASQRDLLLRAIAAVKKSFEDVNNHEKLGVVLRLQHPEATQRQELVRQLHQRLLGLLYGTLTAVYLTEQRSPASGGTLPAAREALLAALDDCGRYFDGAWAFPLEDVFAVGPREAVSAGRSISDVSSLLSVAAAGDSSWTRHLTTWNTVRRLLRFLMAEADSRSSRDEQQTLPYFGSVAGMMMSMMLNRRVLCVEFGFVWNRRHWAGTWIR